MLYDNKKRIIESVLYGVDIQERAIEICKLRLWLSLMVDHDLEVDPVHCEVRAFRKALKQLDPLPNLDFKIRRANTLVDSVHGEPVNLGSLESGEHAGPILKKLISAKHDFYTAHTAKDKRRSRFTIYEATAELAKLEVTWARNRLGFFGNHSNTTYIAELNRAQQEVDSLLVQIRAARRARTVEQEEELERVQAWFDDPRKPTFLWQLDFAEVFYRWGSSPAPGGARQDASDTATAPPVRYGFDIVIGNPPYVRIQALTKSDPNAVTYYRQNYKSARKGNYDVYVVFVERGLQLLDERHGQLGYILPHKFFNARYGEPLRELISTARRLRHVVHFGDQQIFPGATNYVCLLFLSGSPVEHCWFVRVDNLNLWLMTQQGDQDCIAAERIGADAWNFTVGQGGSIFARLSALPVKLGHVTERISQGIRTSANEVYVLTVRSEDDLHVRAFSEQLDEVVSLERRAVYPFLAGRDIKPYCILPSDKVVIIPYRLLGRDATLISSVEYRKEFPSTWGYLRRNQQRLQAREGGRFADKEWHQFGRNQNIDLMLFSRNLRHSLRVPSIEASASSSSKVWVSR